MTNNTKCNKHSWINDGTFTDCPQCVKEWLKENKNTPDLYEGVFDD